MAVGKFITFEGGEGSGKSTQARLLAARLTGGGLSVLPTREPGGSAFAEQVRGLILDPATAPHGPLAEALLFSAARADHLAKTIRPALSAGQWVVCDRFSDSTRVYQGIAGGLGLDAVERLESLVVAPTVPDLTVVMDVAAETGLMRARARNTETTTDPYEARDVDFHRRLQDGFREVAARFPDRCILVDANGSEAAIADHIWSIVVSRFGVR